MNNVVIVSDGQQRDSAIHTYIYPFSSNCPSYLGLDTALSRVPCIIWEVLVDYPF